LTRPGSVSQARRVLLRPRQRSDLPACVAALRAVHDTDGYPHRWPADPEAWLSPGEPIGAWVAEDEGELVGHVLLARVPDDDPLVALLPWAMAEVAEVKRLFVVPVARRRRVGATLLDTASTSARALGLLPVLEVLGRDAAALALYERLGWRRLGQRSAIWDEHHGEELDIQVYASPAT
jgi:GNAT superfamily N-acetyltransferase